jgi:CRP-like cAMP-binding protein
MQTHRSGEELVASLGNFQKLPFLRSFDQKHLAEILRASRVVIYEPDELIIPEGGTDDKLYILLNGKVKVSKNKLWVATIEQSGEVFGELASLGGGSRSASVFAVTKTWCLAVSTAFLKKLSPEDRSACYAVFYRLIANLLAERLRHTTEELAQTYQELELVRNRLAELRRERPGAS